MTLSRNPGPPYEDLICPWQQPPRKTYVFTNANLIDSAAGKVILDATVRISDGRIEEIHQGPTTLAIKNDVHQVDLQGKYLSPGLIDCHVHLAAVAGESTYEEMKALSPAQVLLRQPYACNAMLNRGFTSVRDCGGATVAMKQAIEQGLYPGPRLFIAGHALSQSGGHGDGRKQHDPHEYCGGSISTYHRIVDGVEQCLKFSREEFRQGADFIKIMGGGGVASPSDAIEHVQFTVDEVKAIVTVAKNVGSYVTAHAYTPEAILQAIRQGVRGIEHGNLIDEETVKEMVQRNTYLTPTLVTYATFAREEYAEKFLSKTSEAKNKEVLYSGLKALKLATDAGVKVCFGTDLLGPLQFAQTNEFSIRSKVISSVDIFKSATVTAAELLNRPDFLGQIKPGYAADLLVLDTNPLEDITSLDRPEEHLLAVVKDGRVVTSKIAGLE
ncbi:amidohydrolase-like protein [Dactylonectria estremocensis]|uniref:Amidohydrolase-like protein n=1 Tax=Dactylonectria estremocensis TaxID=1079267 RepID=A0A9P9D5Y6_9HYPO|nr:amidohydrolase-like protein [Dactylonectria estremocensis]KAH7113009.1 amidohydrolase-like protein [Dactylonectria estremocensis]